MESELLLQMSSLIPKLSDAGAKILMFSSLNIIQVVIFVFKML